MDKPRVSVLLLTVAFLTTAVAAANFYVGRNAERDGRLQAEEQLQRIKHAKEALEQERDELAKAKQALEEQVADLGNQARALADQLAREKRTRETLTAEVAQVRKETTQLRGQVANEQKEKKALAEDVVKAKQSYQMLSNELTTLRQAKEALEKRVKEMLAARAKEAEQIVVTPVPAAPGGVSASVPAAVKPAAAAGKGPEGKVLVVNREFDFVVLNLGSKDGLKKGSRLAVLRGDKQILSIEVEKVYENMSAANMLEEEKKGAEVQEGDSVRLIS